jgi:alkanesulfonate monooxygenase SsuD/methylene tetrahydromethanopterin reductase-like flavin-dependent oxidoreductase (luciferase family)
MWASFLAMTGYDGLAPGFEVWPAAPAYCDPKLAAASIERTLEMCELADELGFDSISVSEHHYAPYMMTPNPAVMAAAIIQRVKRARIALLGPLVPLCNPVRLAEELSMLDVMSSGRLSVLFLRGTPNEHKTYDTPAELTTAMTQEGIDLVMKAWRENEPFGWSGKHYQFKTISVWPKVFQQPGPPIYASGNSEGSIRFAAERRIGIGFSFAPADVIAKWISLYRAECERAGWTPTPAHIIYRGITYVAATDRQAADDMAAHFGRKEAEKSKLQSETMGGPPLNALIIGKPYFSGCPATVLDACSTLRQCGVGFIDLVFGIGTPAQQVDSMRLFARDVLPTIQSWSVKIFEPPQQQSISS